MKVVKSVIDWQKAIQYLTARDDISVKFAYWIVIGLYQKVMSLHLSLSLARSTSVPLSIFGFSIIQTSKKGINLP